MLAILNIIPNQIDSKFVNCKLTPSNSSISLLHRACALFASSFSFSSVVVPVDIIIASEPFIARVDVDAEMSP